MRATILEQHGDHRRGHSGVPESGNEGRHLPGMRFGAGFYCEACSRAWDDKLYVLVEFPEDTAFFEEEGIGYPAWNSEDNGARYVPEYDYIRHFRKTPAENSYYKPLRWPESQPYLSPNEPKEAIDALSEPINDEKGIADFGEQAVWVPLCIVK